ncbi:hypothetical protein I656_00463 [Geobacillus sp. WSUCF1]|nr:hypothetical protein I656_00463 [Geobacillus sp. WSUCF1]
MILIWQRHAISLLVLSFYRISLNKKRRHERFLPVSKLGARPFSPINRLLMRVTSYCALFRKTKYSYIKIKSSRFHACLRYWGVLWNVVFICIANM